ncbi:MAG: hypothetical protein OEY49_09295, partial [Candidatus Heimdallarchaeota archaeon]|nr:hypothetical protein [Candidatus Heimdallarchaeota archaeon]
VVILQSFYLIIGIPINDPFLNPNIHTMEIVYLLLSLTLFIFFINVGISLFLFNIVIHPNFVYNIPIPIVNIMIYNSSGMAVYNKFVDVENLSIKFEEQLLSGALSAISSLIHETLGMDAKLDHFNAGSFQIYFNRIYESSTTIVAITMGESSIISKSLKNFTRMFPDTLLAEINEPVISTEFTKNVDEMLKQSFPYITLK